MAQEFIKGLELSRRFYDEAVKPILSRNFPALRYSAGLLGNGSDVLGFDTPQSTDHDWGPRLMLFLSENDFEKSKDEINGILRKELPVEFLGYSTNFGFHPDGTTVMAGEDDNSVNHRVEIFSIIPFFEKFLKFNPKEEIQPADWVGIPQNNLLIVTAGSVFHDGLAELAPIREKLHYYPHDIWLYTLSAQWMRISQEEHFMGRCGQVSDELGSRIIAARLVRDIMCLCFMMERKYFPYIKWFGSAFKQLESANNLLPVLLSVMNAESWQERQDHLSFAYEFIAEKHNSLQITEQLHAKVSRFHKRPFMVIHAEEFADAIWNQIKSREVLALPKFLGAVDQFTDSTDALNYLEDIKSIYKKAFFV